MLRCLRGFFTIIAALFVGLVSVVLAPIVGLALFVLSFVLKAAIMLFTLAAGNVVSNDDKPPK